ncbi:MAG: transposase [Candidatus Latescibacteria bacterium]|nr:transposase [Candidatus Latescibacterota bacterium]
MAERLTAQEKLHLVIEGLKGDVSASELCRRADIWPTQLYRYKKRGLEGALEVLSSRQGKKDPEKEALKAKIERLKQIITSQAAEIDLLKKERTRIIRSDQR